MMTRRKNSIIFIWFNAAEIEESSLHDDMISLVVQKVLTTESKKKNCIISPNMNRIGFCNFVDNYYYSREKNSASKRPKNLSFSMQPRVETNTTQPAQN